MLTSRRAVEGIEEVKKVVRSGSVDLLILDEANIAVSRGLISRDDLLEVMEMKPRDMELVITGRYADNEIMAKADLVTEMREIKHPYRQGILAQRGIDW